MLSTTSPTSPPSAGSLPGRARHPRSRAERMLLRELSLSIDNALHLASSSLGERELSDSRRPPPPVLTIGDPQLLSNGGARLFYTPPPVTGAGLRSRGHPFSSTASSRSGLPPDDEATLRHYGVQQLSDYARATMLGELTDYLPSHRHEGGARVRFDALLSRVQQHQLARTIQNELRAQRPDAMWNWAEDRFHLAPVTGARHVIDVDAWTAFIRGGGEPANDGSGLAIIPDILAEVLRPDPVSCLHNIRNAPAQRKTSPTRTALS